MVCYLQWNMQSYRTKFNDLKTLVSHNAPDCVCLQETLSGDNNLLPPSRYSIIQSPVVRADNHERSTALLVRDVLPHDVLPLNTTLQSCAVTIYLPRKITVCTLYLPHLPVSYDDLADLIAQLPRPFLLLGDMNAKSPQWGACNATTDHRGALFERLLLDLDLVALNDGSPTHYHVQTDSYSAIDLSLCSSDIAMDYTFRVLDDLHGSDHYPICLSSNLPDGPMALPERFNFRKADWPLFSSLTVVRPNDAVFHCEDVDELVASLESIIMTAALNAIPRKGICSGIPVPWFSNECRVVKRERLRAQRAYQRTPSLYNKIAYSRCRARCRYIYAQSREGHWREYLSTINARSSLHRIWKKVAKLSGKFKRTPSPVISLPCGTMLTDPVAVANRLASAFSEVTGDHNYSAPFLAHKRASEARPPNFRSSAAFSYNDAITMMEVSTCLRMTVDSSPGVDGITYGMLKNVDSSLLSLIHKLFNLIYTHHVFPSRWRLAVVVPIVKPGKDPKLASSYRPISLTCCLCKLLEKIINYRLMWFLESGNFINATQSGFRRNRSTIDNLVALESDIQEAISDRRHSLAVFFDLKKAYDTAWRQGILCNLFDYGMRGHLPIFIRNFLCNRSIRVRVGGSLSEAFQLQDGVPQGSVLSCTCFLIAINHITDGISPNVTAHVYVDDLVIYSSGRSSALLERRLQTAITSVCRWANNVGFTFSSEKTVALHICRKHNCPKIAANLTLNGSPIRSVDSYRYLGVTFDSSLTWRPHILALKRSCSKGLSLLKHLTHRHWGADRVALLRLYIMLIKPKLDYGVEAYSSASPSLLSTVDPIQNAAIRIATGAFRSSPLLSLYAESGLKPPALFRDIKLLNYLYRVRATPSNPLHERLETLRANVAVDAPEAPQTRGFFHRALCLLHTYNLSLSHIMLETPAPCAPWRPVHVSVCEDLFHKKKSDYAPGGLKEAFLLHRNSHNRCCHIYTDGSKSDAGVGYAYTWNTTSFTKRIQSHAGIFSAELFALYSCLSLAARSPHRNVVVFTDSRSSVLAIRKIYASHPLVNLIQCRLLHLRKMITLCWVPSHVEIVHNDRVDRLARDSVLTRAVSNVLLPRCDHQNFVKYTVTHKWRERWLATPLNKYREISDSARPLPSASTGSRIWSICLTRLRIGHSRLTHQHLMDRSHQPYCEDCIVPLTIKHILVECPSHSEVRIRFRFPAGATIAVLLSGPLCALGGPVYLFCHHLGLLDQL